MASPTVAECDTLLQKWADACEELRAFCESNAKNWAGASGLEDAFVQALESDYAVEMLQSLAGMRAGLNAALGGSTNVLEGILRTYGKAIGAPETEPQALFTRLYDYFVANTKTVKSRSFSYGSPSAGGSNVGTGTINRLTTDENGYAIESKFIETMNAKVVRDQNNGVAEHEEVFEVRGAAPGRDLLIVAGSGLVRNYACVSGRNSMLANPSFSKYSGTSAVPTDITDWTVGSSLSNFEIDESNYYRDFFGDTLNSGAAGSASLKIKGNDTIAQALTVRGTVLDPAVPVYLQIAYNRQVGAGDGTLTLYLGSQSTAVALAAQTGWNILRVAIGTKNWQKNHNEADMDIKIQLASRTTGYVLVDDVIFCPFEPWDTDWILPVGGATPFLLNDTFSWSDTVASDSKIQRHLMRTMRRMLPHSGAPSISDP